MSNIYDFSPGIVPSQTGADSEPSKSKPKRSKHRETLTSSQTNEGKRTLYSMVEEAFNTLRNAMEHADYNNAVKAAVAVLDRAGFGPKSTVDVNTTALDLSNLSKEELAERASKIAAMLRAVKSREDIGKIVAEPTQTIN